MKNLNSILALWVKATKTFERGKPVPKSTAPAEKAKISIKKGITALRDVANMGLGSDDMKGAFVAKRNVVGKEMKKYKVLLDKEATANRRDNTYPPFQTAVKVLTNIVIKLDPNSVETGSENEPDLTAFLANVQPEFLQDITDDGNDDDITPTGSNKKLASKLSGEMEDFERRKAKVMLEVAKLQFDDPLRFKLTQAVSGAYNDGVTGSFKAAFQKLDAVKDEARKATKGMTQPLENKIRDHIQKLAANGELFVRGGMQVQTKLQTLDQSIVQKFPQKSAAIQDPGQLQQFKIDFTTFEAEARKTLEECKRENDALAALLAKQKVPQQIEALEIDIDVLEEENGGASGSLPDEFRVAVSKYQKHGKVMTPAFFQGDYALLVKQILTKIIDWKQGLLDQDGEKVPELFKNPEGQLEKGLNEAKDDALTDQVLDELNIDGSTDKKRTVKKAFDWKDGPTFRAIKNGPPNPGQLTPLQVQQEADRVAGHLTNALKNGKPDSDLTFDLSLQTPSQLLNTLVNEKYQATDPPQGFVDEKTQLEKDPNLGRNPYLRELKKFVALKNDTKNSKDFSNYLKNLTSLEGKIKEIADDPEFATKFPNLAPRVTALLQEVKREKASVQPMLENLQTIADKMHETILANCPNKASTETETMKTKEGEVKIPKKLSLNGVDFTDPVYLSEGGLGAVSIYKDAQGKTVVVKSLLTANVTPDDLARRQKDLVEELKVHRHVLGGENGQGNENVVDLKGVLRGPDGSMHMVLEHADGGDMDQLGQSIRQLGKRGLLSREAQNALSQDALRQMVLGVAYVQDQNVAHLDVKGLNCFMTKDGKLKLGDYGTSRIATTQEGDIGQAPETTPKFRAPEVNSQAPDSTVKADNYAVGAVIASFMSPTEREDIQRFSAEFKAPPTLTALDRLQNALLDPDPKKRPSLDTVKESMFLDDVDAYDPKLLAKLSKAAIAYSLKAGKEVGAHQEEMNLYLGKMQSAKDVAPKDDASIQSEANRSGPKAVTDAISSVGDAVRRGQALMGMDGPEIQRQGFDLLKDALQYALNAQKYYQKLNLNNPNLLQTVEGQIALVQQEIEKGKKALQEKIDAEQKKIDAINERPEVKPLLEALQKADQDLRRGSGDELDIANIKDRNAMLKDNLDEHLSKGLDSATVVALRGIHTQLATLETDIDQLVQKANKDQNDEAALKQKVAESKKLQDDFEAAIIRGAMPKLVRSIAAARLSLPVRKKLQDLSRTAMRDFQAGKIEQASLIMSRISNQLKGANALKPPTPQELQAEIQRRQQRQQDAKGEAQGSPYLESGDAIMAEVVKLKGKINGFMSAHPDKKNNVVLLLQNIREHALKGSVGMARDLVKELTDLVAEKETVPVNS